MSPKSAMEQEKRIRREIANSNERRRMQSINAGFDSLKTLLPHNEGEKLSKVSVNVILCHYLCGILGFPFRGIHKKCNCPHALSKILRAFNIFLGK